MVDAGGSSALLLALSLGPSLRSFTAAQMAKAATTCRTKRFFVAYMLRSVSEIKALVMPPRQRVSESGECNNGKVGK